MRNGCQPEGNASQTRMSKQAIGAIYDLPLLPA